ncbi:MAG: hypothetical protein QXM52_07000 [Candidatus Bathyarchaeia archaeon]
MPRKRKTNYASSHLSVSTSPDDLVLDTTGEERFCVFEVCTRMCKYTAALLMASATLSTFMLIQYFMGFQTLVTIFQTKLFAIIALGFVGMINLICGLLLLATEKP